MVHNDTKARNLLQGAPPRSRACACSTRGHERSASPFACTEHGFLTVTSLCSSRPCASISHSLAHRIVHFARAAAVVQSCVPVGAAPDSRI
eukprot:6178662-Pleurochrysis_carterae.AAC.1